MRVSCPSLLTGRSSPGLRRCVHCHGGGGEFPQRRDCRGGSRRRQGASPPRDDHPCRLSCVTAFRAEVLRARAKTLTELALAGEIAGIHFEGPFVPTSAAAPRTRPTSSTRRAAHAHLIEDRQGHALSRRWLPRSLGACGPGSVAEAPSTPGERCPPGATPTRLDEGPRGPGILRERHAVATKRGPRATITHLFFNGMRPSPPSDTGPIVESSLPTLVRAAARLPSDLRLIHVSPCWYVGRVRDGGARARRSSRMRWRLPAWPRRRIHRSAPKTCHRQRRRRARRRHHRGRHGASGWDCVRGRHRGAFLSVDAVYMASAQEPRSWRSPSALSRPVRRPTSSRSQVPYQVRRVWRRGTVVAGRGKRSKETDCGARRVRVDGLIASSPCRARRNAGRMEATIRRIIFPCRASTPAPPARDPLSQSEPRTSPRGWRKPLLGLPQVEWTPTLAFGVLATGLRSP